MDEDSIRAYPVDDECPFGEYVKPVCKFTENTNHEISYNDISKEDNLSFESTCTKTFPYNSTKKPDAITKKRGIPTIGPRGIQFRSRLEAKYAHFWTYLGWDWDYEPIDLKGYIPDFAIYPCEGKSLLIEIKGDITYEFRGALEKLVNSGYQNTCLFFGSRSPHLDYHKNVVIDAKFAAPLDWNSKSKEAWFFRDDNEYYGDKRNKREWIILNDINLSFCANCYSYVPSTLSTCLLCHGKTTTEESFYNDIVCSWSNFCNQTRWDGPSRSSTSNAMNENTQKDVVISPKKDANIRKDANIFISSNTKKPANKRKNDQCSSTQEHGRFTRSRKAQDNPYHAFDINDVMKKVSLQYEKEGSAFLCEHGECDWDVIIGWLNQTGAIYSSAKEGFCCGGCYVYIDKIP